MLLVAAILAVARGWFIRFYQRSTRGDWRLHPRPATPQEAPKLLWGKVLFLIPLGMAFVVYGLLKT
jgi:hypothetical protein